ncbi:MAG TPA: hypothetical protein VHC01_04305 [Gaiellaceae bacterium]|nr:hypothetical protein [Gaiellaceae bacterium]
MSFVAGACAAVLLACGPGQTTAAHGRLLVVRAAVGGSLRVVDLQTGRTRWRLPPGVLTGSFVVHRDGSLLTWFDVATGARVGDAVLQTRGAFALVGASQDGQTAVLARTETRSTTFALVSPRGWHEVSRAGHWRFAALAGGRLTLVPSARHGPGRAISAVDSSAGRYRLTLYRRGLAESVQALDTRTGRSRILALGGLGYSLVPDSEDGQVWAVSLAAGRVALLDATTGATVSSFQFPALARASYTVASLAPDGEHLAATDGDHVLVFTPATRSARQVAVHASIALGWSPDERTLWVLGERSRFSPLRPRLVR